MSSLLAANATGSTNTTLRGMRLRYFAYGLLVASLLVSTLYWNGNLRWFWAGQTLAFGAGIALLYVSFMIKPKPEVSA